MQIQVNTDRHIKGSPKLTGEVETIVQHALARFDDRITRVEVFLSDENSPQKFGDADKRCVIEVRLGGLRPITVHHEGSSLDQAVSGAAERLEKTLKRTLGRKDSIVKRRARERAELTAAASILQHDAETGKRDDFMKVLCPLLGCLGQHAARELQIMEADGTLYPGQVIFANLIDETVSRAWLQFTERPQWMALDLWLTKILDEILEEQVQQGHRIQGATYSHTDENYPHVDEQEWWSWLLGEDETTTDDGGLPNRKSLWAEEFADAEELMYRIHALLGELPKARRRAFVLNALDAYDVSEVAMLQGRPESEVLADIELARNELRQRLCAGTPPQAPAEAAEAADATKKT